MKIMKICPECGKSINKVNTWVCNYKDGTSERGFSFRHNPSTEWLQGDYCVKYFPLNRRYPKETDIWVRQ